MIHFWKSDIYNGTKLLEAYSDEYVDKDIEVLLSTSHEDDNIWNADIQLEIFVTKDGHFGVTHLIPSGYSEYTYDPEVTTKIFKNLSFDDFIDLGLDAEERSMLGYSEIKKLSKRFESK